MGWGGTDKRMDAPIFEQCHSSRICLQALEKIWPNVRLMDIGSSSVRAGAKEPNEGQ
jgi:hypothetical protein